MSEHLTDYETEPARSAYHDALPVGERLSAQPLLESPFVGFEGDVRMKPLEPMLVPERPRSGVEDPSACFHCGPGREHAIWADEHWHVGAGPDTGLPFVAGLAPNAHARLDQLEPGLLATFGGVVQRLAGAIQDLDGVARTHFSRWGDGSAHFHMHFMARPLGMMQGRGAMLAFWDDVLPRVDADLLATHRRQVAAAMAEGGGTSLL
jgi:hypothetical protein